MNEEKLLDVALIFDKTRNIDNTYDLITELFSDTIFNEKEQSVKYYVFSMFLLKNIKFPFQEIWRLFKIIISINPNMTKEQTETNKYFGNCLKLCVKFLHKSISTLNFDKNIGFKSKDVPAIFDFLFSFPLMKHYINLIESENQRNEINEILTEVTNIINDKIKAGKNNVVKNVFSNFYHFLDINEKEIIIPNNKKPVNEPIIENKKKKKV